MLADRPLIARALRRLRLERTRYVPIIVPTRPHILDEVLVRRESRHSFSVSYSIRSFPPGLAPVRDLNVPARVDAFFDGDER